MIGQIGIDIDWISAETTAIKIRFLDSIRDNSKLFGQIIHDRETTHGHHFKIKLHKKVSFWRSIEIRYKLRDDTRRMFFDIMRHRAGGKMIDVLFDKKTYCSKD